MNSDAEAQFRAFVEARSFALRRTAYALTGDLHAAEDLVQDALAKLVRHWHRVDDPERYVRRTIYNTQVSKWRRRWRLREDPFAHPPDEVSRDATRQVNLRLDLTKALLRLGPRQRAVLVLRFYEDLPERDVADILNCSVGTVRSQTSRALARLREAAPELSSAATTEEVST
ncbi:MAG TPA: SigE family RNA polymerase sigma factor [Jiangellaceae bacterium]|nr:SigE family RNA polymerase sigma factor [Jiangellaceae bacterium]